jgi:hypothetical protein
MERLTNTLSWSMILLFSILFVTCSKDDEEPVPGGPAELMFVNGLTDATNLNLTVAVADSTYLGLTAPFGFYSLYNTVNGGNQKVELKNLLTSSLIASSTLKIAGGKNYTLMAAGTTTNAELVLKEDDLSIPDTTKGYLRLINLSPNSPGMTMSITAGAELASNVAYKSVSDFTSLAVGNYDLTIKSGNTVVSTIASFKILPKRKYSILMTGLVNQTPKASHNIIVYYKQ